MLTGPSAAESIDQRLDALAQQPFRARFHLRGRERALVQLRGRDAIRRHAEDLERHRADLQLVAAASRRIANSEHTFPRLTTPNQIQTKALALLDVKLAA